MSRYFLAQLHEAQGGRCAWCGDLMPAVGDVALNEQMQPSIDHVVPTALGGSNDAYNKVAMHRSCNGAKKANLPPNGCVLIWQHVVHAKLEIETKRALDAMTAPGAARRGATLSDVWPKR